MTWQDSYQVWKNEKSLDEPLKLELDEMSEDAVKLEDAFYAPLEFGTAGMRGLMEPGINRMNIYTVRQATEGLALFMDTLSEKVKKQGVAISYDSRHHSQEFAYESARVLGAHGIPSFVFESLRPTPELSFAVRHLNAYAGIMITASHNPKAYNGYKIYGPDGGQMPPKEAGLITTYIRKVTHLFGIQVADQAEILANGLLKVIGEEVDRAYLDEIKTVTIDSDLVHKEGRDMKLVYTPLHGTGKMLGSRALTEAGFEHFVLVPEQAEPDGDFPTVKLPNPEDAAAFDLAIKLGREINADVLIASDPDADRLGAAIATGNGEYQLLTGNQIAAILLHYILVAHKNKGTLPENAVAVKSIVSSELPTKIAESFNVEMIDVLTGFKFIAEQIEQYEETNAHTFMFGFEESYGFLIKPFVRDKDAIQALVLLAEVAAYYKSLNKTLADALNELLETYGHFGEKTVSMTFAGIEGSAKIKALMAKFRQEAPKEFAGHAVDVAEDFNTRQKNFSDGRTESTGLPKADVLKYHLEDGSWIAIRPSGTEPKIKFYVGAVADSQAALQTKIDAFEKAINQIVEE